MKLNILFIFNAILGIVFGIGFVLAPETMSRLYGITISPGTNLAGQFYGVTLIGIGLICWMFRNIRDPDSQHAIVRAQFIHNIIGIFVAVMGTTSGAMNAVGWSAVAIYLVLALAYGYFQFGKTGHS